MGIKKKHPQGVEQFADSTNTQANATPHQDYITKEHIYEEQVRNDS